MKAVFPTINTLFTSPKWNGLAWSPLPYESCSSVLWRFAWRNALDGRTMRKLSRERFPLLSWSEEFRGESALLHNFCLAEKRSVYKICPICSEAAYYTFLFQLSDLLTCPIHNCRLISRCQCCGASTNEYFSQKQCYDNPFTCAQCHHAISGMWPCLEAHIEFRVHEKEIEERFNPLDKWVRKVSERGNMLRGLLEEKVTSKRWEQRAQRAIILNAISDIRLPLQLSVESKLKSFALTWSIRLAQPISEAVSHKHYSANYWGPLHGTYKATLRRLQRWLVARRAKMCNSNYVDILKLKDRHTINARGWDLCELAFVLLRWSFECGHDPSSPWEEIKWAHFYGPAPGFCFVDKRVLRMPLRAALLGAYGLMYISIRCVIRDGLINLADLPRGINFCTYSNDYLRHAGVVLMPQVEDLDPAEFGVNVGMSHAWKATWKSVLGLKYGP
jgi:hypothetical protein